MQQKAKHSCNKHLQSLSNPIIQRVPGKPGDNGSLAVWHCHGPHFKHLIYRG